jgi:hypothetical protein
MLQDSTPSAAKEKRIELDELMAQISLQERHTRAGFEPAPQVTA